ncbi:alpha-E domain-containing protein [Pseudothauera nasutitermitis]|uniref:Alpha-E domain-containing protein n=1 Tax=Pseudothauera nasutitermitis TaxID=2565930 RepID=A0A4S4B682_9RHOO|nr:alpha-E domain-containing protein [Pseudothauera nasutitermitis]THF66477.1 alpha-E domain-containing protein [Pseudothauera nasutitermitis]
MLSRTADHLYWMARYMERAENVARILDVNHRMSMMPQSAVQEEQAWGATLRIMGLEAPFHQRYAEITPDAVLEFMIFDDDNPSSVRNCLRAARENAHAVRGTLTSELWETTNGTWLKMRDFTREQFADLGASEFFEWVKYRSHLSRGVTIGTMLQDESLRFTRLGTFLERADNTARILDVKYQLLLPAGEVEGGAADYYQWSALLRSVSAFEVYRKVYRDLITPSRVAELLLLRVDMPRSIARCMKEVYTNLREVANDQSAETERRAGELEAQLRFGRIDDIVRDGLHNYVVRLLARVQDLGNRIADDFLVPVSGSRS